MVADWLAAAPPTAYNDGARYFRADDDAPYVARYPIDLGQLGPQVAKPFSPDNVVAGRRSRRAARWTARSSAPAPPPRRSWSLGALVLEQALADGADAARRARSASSSPATCDPDANLREAGLWAIYERAGFTVDPPGCSMCLGVASRKAGKGEVWLVSQNRNFENRMGEGSLAWLASAATVAASALGDGDHRPAPAARERVDRDRLRPDPPARRRSRACRR